MAIPCYRCKEEKEMCEQCGYIQPITTLNQTKDE